MKGYYVSDANYRTNLILIYIKLLLSKQGNSSYLLSEAIQKLLLPDGTYGCSSGGEPLAIPQLTWQKLKQFHQDHFHPSNTTYFLYVLHVNIHTYFVENFLFVKPVVISCCISVIIFYTIKTVYV